MIESMISFVVGAPALVLALLAWFALLFFKAVIAWVSLFLAGPQPPAESSELIRLTKENLRLERYVKNLGDRIIKRDEAIRQLRGEVLDLHHRILTGADAAPPPAPGLDMPTIRKLLQLCHEDKHGGSPLSREVTAMLLDRKRQLTGR